MEKINPNIWFVFLPVVFVASMGEYFKNLSLMRLGYEKKALALFVDFKLSVALKMGAS
ncbi:hypothetical protein [Desulfobacter hydrogenophilus]|uniref:hypothetical protein n=1 Tax=Desulfobacter hydrogenophilus TaxID=2291 RepID=UPI0013D38F7E|nr:hypothetical protein [Desulfobacter hydrogenophilus]NDY72432.1 hypothetical protein [Desulfobacter hydrogenophilus]